MNESCFWLRGKEVRTDDADWHERQTSRGANVQRSGRRSSSGVSECAAQDVGLFGRGIKIMIMITSKSAGAEVRSSCVGRAPGLAGEKLLASFGGEIWVPMNRDSSLHSLGTPNGNLASIMVFHFSVALCGRGDAFGIDAGSFSRMCMLCQQTIKTQLNRRPQRKQRKMGFSITWWPIRE